MRIAPPRERSPLPPALGPHQVMCRRASSICSEDELPEDSRSTGSYRFERPFLLEERTVDRLSRPLQCDRLHSQLTPQSLQLLQRDGMQSSELSLQQRIR